jgi:hypothetical protein
MKSSDILNIFIEQHRLCSPLDPEANPYAKLSFDTTIDEWRDANDFIHWQPLSRYLNTQFNIDISEEDWKRTLTPASKRTLADLCQLISEHWAQQDIQPIILFGQECISAAIFLTLKKYLQRRNVDVSELRPSTLVTEYFEKHFSEMIEQITIISKGRQIFDEFGPKRKKEGFINYINIFDKDRYMFLTGDVLTFRDLVQKIISLNTIEQSCI